MCILELKKVEIIEWIGRGSQGNVYRGTLSGEVAAIKKIALFSYEKCFKTALEDIGEYTVLK